MSLRRFVSPIAARLAAAVVLGLSCTAFAQVAVPADGSITPDFVNGTQKWLDEAVQKTQAAGSQPLRIEVSLGTLDARLRLAPCARVEPYIPTGMRLWGRTRLGLRCIDGSARWNVFLPVTVKAMGPGWVLRDNVMPGKVLAAEDAVEAEVDWAAENSPVVADMAQWLGQSAAHTLAAGQPLRMSMIKATQVFAAGSNVRVVATGTGFQISSDAQALTGGVVGQPVRLRMENGRITNGIVEDARTVRLAM